ncbi:unnamed protein product [Umbelopsis vinacea]
MTSFGTDLKDQVPIIADHVADGIAFLDEFRSFAKDRVQLEREYAQKLEGLCRKYNSKRQKVVAKPVAAQSTRTEDEWDWTDKSSSTSNAWTCVLQQTEVVARTRYQLAEDLATSIADVLKTMAMKKEEARKKHVGFYQKLKSDRDKAYAEKDKAKQAYDDACAEVENVRAKIERGTGDQEKHNRHLEQAIIECNNRKNLYILSIGVANAEKAKYFDTDIPELSDASIFAYNLPYLKLNTFSHHTQTLKASIEHVNSALDVVGKIDPEIDAAVFVRKAVEKVQFEKDAQVQFTFMPWNGGGNPSVIIDRNAAMVVDDSAAIFLNNYLVKNKRKLNEVNNELSRKLQEVAKLKEKMTDFAQGQKYGTYDEINEVLADAQRHVTVISTYKAKYETEIELITASIGEDGLHAKAHEFKPTSFTIPTTCDYCETTVWGLAKQGMTCKACGYNCHAKCEMKVPPNCTRVKGKVDRQKSLSRAGSFRPKAGGGNKSESPNSSTPSLAVSSNPTTENRAYAIYDYDAANPDEISIKEGDEVTVVEPDDGSGWIKIRLNSNQGLVPANYVETARSGVAAAIDIPTEDGKYVRDSLVSPVIDEHIEEETGGVADQVEYVTAMYDFDGQSTEELSIKEGDRIILLNRDEGGWWHVVPSMTRMQLGEVRYGSMHMDTALEFLDTYLLDSVYAKVFPATVVANATSTAAVTSALARDNDIRIALSIFVFVTLGGWFFYLTAACFSYYVFFDHETMKHPKFLKNQVSLEIDCAVKAVPGFSLLTVPWFWGEVKGYSLLYEGTTAYGGIPYMALTVAAFLFFTDFGIYWIHRGLHHPSVYKTIHKPHHKWIVPTPFASHAFHPLDGYVQSIPYHLFVYIIPMNKWLYIAMFIFVNCWTVMIHDGNFLLRSSVINSSAHHSVHHLYFNYNYGQYFTLWDRFGGSHRQPTEEQYNDLLRNDQKVWAKQAFDAEQIEKDSHGAKKVKAN